MTDFVTVYSEATGRKQRVPAHYMDNPVLSRGLRLVPSAVVKDDDPAQGVRPPPPPVPPIGPHTTTNPGGIKPPAETPATGEEE
jgi:hypothetical protein